MCNCIEEKEKALAEKFGYKAVVLDADLVSGRIFVGFGGTDENGKAFAGKKMLVSYCPFCGKPYDKGREKCNGKQ